MSAPLQSPLRVLVKGASTVNWISWMGGPRSDFTFPRVLEAQLAADGWPSEVRAITMASEKTSTILRTWQSDVISWSPDVIVLVYGHFETIHLFLPRWLERHARSMRTKPRRLSKLYRTYLLNPLWMALAHLQAALDARIPGASRRRRLKRVAADLDAYIDRVQQVGSPMVVLFELLPPATKFRAWFPGMAARIELMNQELAGVVARQDKPRVRLLRVSELVDKHFDGNVDVATADGFHYVPELHREVGIALAREVEEWAATQPHLARSHTTDR
ncbi:MAG TPA: hypothetical protein VJ782_02920 [Aeromicrobium sp.]|nr:hypothetical protein [Aeromicrobium sp.]